MRRRALPARGRSRGDRAGAVRRVRPRHRTGAAVLSRRGPPAGDPRRRKPRGDIPSRAGEPPMILLKSPEEIDRMRRANAIVAEILAELRARVRPGVTTAEVDALAEELTRKKGARPAFKGYAVGGRVYPASVCISINDEVVHGIPSPRRVLSEGDIVGLDFGVCYEGYFGDAAVTVPVRRVTPEAERLMRVTAAALAARVDAIRPGAHAGGISAAIQDTGEAAGFSTVGQFVGPGTGRSRHGD